MTAYTDHTSVTGQSLTLPSILVDVVNADPNKMISGMNRLADLRHAAGPVRYAHQHIAHEWRVDHPRAAARPGFALAFAFANVEPLALRFCQNPRRDVLPDTLARDLFQKIRRLVLAGDGKAVLQQEQGGSVRRRFGKADESEIHRTLADDLVGLDRDFGSSLVHVGHRHHALAFGRDTVGCGEHPARGDQHAIAATDVHAEIASRFFGERVFFTVHDPLLHFHHRIAICGEGKGTGRNAADNKEQTAETAPQFNDTLGSVLSVRFSGQTDEMRFFRVHLAIDAGTVKCLRSLPRNGFPDKCSQSEWNFHGVEMIVVGIGIRIRGS